MKKTVPALWLLTLISGLPQFSETVYTPSLPCIAKALSTSASMVEYTLTIYLLSFSLGVLFWGRLSDRYGRKSCLLMGIAIFIVGSAGCYFSSSIEMLMVSRFVQAFGGSTGSVLGQSICRDVFTGTDLAKAYSTVGMALSLFPAMGPVIGAVVAQYLGWRNIFIVLILFALSLKMAIIYNLNETSSAQKNNQVTFKNVLSVAAYDRKFWGFGALVGLGWGMNFCYFAEAPFYLISLLGLSTAHYGITFLGISAFAFLGNQTNRWGLKYYSIEQMVIFGLAFLITDMLIFSGVMIVNQWVHFAQEVLIGITLLAQTFLIFSISIINSNALGVALKEYKWCTGTASSLFGFYYYAITVFLTLGIGVLHNGTLLPMPLYFLSISCLMGLIYKFLLK